LLRRKKTAATDPPSVLAITGLTSYRVS